MSMWSAITALWTRGKGTRFPMSAIAFSVFIHLGIGLSAAFITIAVIYSRQPVMFEAKPPPGISARKLEHSIRVKQMQKQSRRPQILQRLMSKSPSTVALPELPHMASPDLRNLHDSPLLNSKAGSELGGLGGLGGGAGRGLTGGTGYSDTRFFGENVRTRAICVLMDISASIIAKGVLEDVRRETKTMLENMSPVTKFNIIVYVDGAQPFSEQMVFATQENKTAALKWLEGDFDTTKPQNHSLGNRSGYSGSTPSMAIETAVSMGCDTMFVLTDDPPYLKSGNMETGVEIPDHMEKILDYARSIESRFGRQVKINGIAYKPFKNERGDKAIEFYKKLAQITGGRFRMIREDE